MGRIRTSRAKIMRKYLLLLPCALFLLITLGFGIVTSIIQSLGFIPSLELREFTLKYYLELFNDKSFLTSILFNFEISIISSVIALILGVLVSYSLYKKYSKLSFNLLKLPLIIPHIIGVLIIITIFSQSGILSRILFNLGLITSNENFPLLINDNNGLGIILTYVWKETAFIAIVTYGIMNKIDKNIVLSAKNLGANDKTIFLKIIMPLCKKGILTNFLIIFAFSFTSFEVPYLIGPTAKRTLPVKAYIEYTSDIFNRPYAMAVNMILILISLIILILYTSLTKESEKEEK